MATTNVSLPDPMIMWIKAQTVDGRYGNASDYDRDLIRRDQDRHQANVERQQRVDDGIASSPK